VDIAELSERLVLFTSINEDPDVTIKEVVTMPGHPE
jgi:hypothetical protein